MERIVIEVDEATAKKWRKVSPKVKNRLEKSFQKQIEIVSQSDKEAREEAAKNGLTEEILQQLLNEK